MIDLNLKINKDESYLNSGNIFSKSLLIKNSFSKDDKILLIVNDEKVIDAYKKIFDFLRFDLFVVDNYASFVSAVFSDKWFFILKKEFFEYDKLSFYDIKKSHLLSLKKSETYDQNNLIEKLNSLWYVFSDSKNKASYKKSWDSLHIYPHFSDDLYILDFFDDILDNIFLQKKLSDKYDYDLSKKATGLDEIFLWKVENLDFDNTDIINNDLIGILNKSSSLIILDELDFYKYFSELKSSLKNYLSFDLFKSNNSETRQGDLHIKDLFLNDLDDFKKVLEDKIYKKKYIISKNDQTIKNFLEYNNIKNTKLIPTKLNSIKSFVFDDNLFIWDDNISKIFVKKRVKRSLSKNLDLLLQIKSWDYVVHSEHGIWIFAWIIKKTLPQADWKILEKEYIEIDYKNNDKLFVPVSELRRVSKYVWVQDPELSNMWTKEWSKRLKKVEEDTQKIAEDLLEIYAKRHIQSGFVFLPDISLEQRFQSDFPYEYTSDQINSIEEILSDMESEKTMDRLLSGDVWFGKTELAFNAIFRAFINKKQSVLISPLVVLAYEHFDKAISRFRNFPIKIEVITRLEKAKNQEKVLRELREWKIDLVIWTHRLLSEDVEFKNLGLVVLDEEHKFGVKDKEKIKNLKWNVDLLSMSATPIPRSLNLALSSIKDISMLTTPPFGRKDIETYISKFDEQVIKNAMDKEFARWWQVFFVHNRVTNIENMKNYLEEIYPGKKIIISHGQLPGAELEDRIIDFRKKKYDILLTTTVIENWVDFPNVNTIIISEADRFGISQIHQLRWRVWRSDKQWYCYLFYKKDKISEDSSKRLKTILEYSHLWAWFELAMRDLEIRWSGDILGIKQSWKSKEIGLSLFLEMLENKVEELKFKQDYISWNIDEKSFINKKINTDIDLNISAFVSDDFFSSELDKINFYREIESLDNLWDLENIIDDFKNLNKTDFPDAVNNFFWLLRLKLKAKDYNIISIKRLWRNYQIDFSGDTSLEELKKFLVLDRKVKFSLITAHRLRSESKNFSSEIDFLDYMLGLFDKKLSKKVKIKRKNI